MCCLLSLIRTPFSFNQSERGIVNASGSIFIRPITNGVLQGKLRTALSSVEMNNRLVLKHKLLGKTRTSYRYRGMRRERVFGSMALCSKADHAEDLQVEFLVRARRTRINFEETSVSGKIVDSWLRDRKMGLSG